MKVTLHIQILYYQHDLHQNLLLTQPRETRIAHTQCTHKHLLAETTPTPCPYAGKIYLSIYLSVCFTNPIHPSKHSLKRKHYKSVKFYNKN